MCLKNIVCFENNLWCSCGGSSSGHAMPGTGADIFRWPALDCSGLKSASIKKIGKLFLFCVQSTKIRNCRGEKSSTCRVFCLISVITQQNSC